MKDYKFHSEKNNYLASSGPHVFVIRFDADNLIGTGHYSRCYALGQHLEALAHKVVYISKHIHSNIERTLFDKGKTIIKVPNSIEWGEEVEFVLDHLRDIPSAAFLDVSTPYALENLSGISGYLECMRKICKTVLFDGMDSNALAPKIDTDIDIVVVPYLGAAELGYHRKPEACTLVGPKYFVFSESYHQPTVSTRIIRKQADRLLVTLGGADPFGVTKMVVAAISFIEDIELDIRVIVGPNFQSSLIQDIADMTVSKLHRFNIVASPDTLAEHMVWSDMAISSSGLTKYELAITGTPSLQISFSDNYAHINQFFVCHGSARHLGVYDKIESEVLAQEIRLLLTDYPTRMMMHRAGKTLFDAHATNRLLVELGRLL